MESTAVIMPSEKAPNHKPLTLDQALAGQTVRVSEITNPETAMLAMRLGVSTGELLTISSKIPGGPLVVRRGKADIALGRELCKEIRVESPSNELKTMGDPT